LLLIALLLCKTLFTTDCLYLHCAGTTLVSTVLYLAMHMWSAQKYDIA